MELFLPGVIVILLAAFFSFLVLPRMGTVVLASVSIIALLIAAYHHYYMFSSEYRLSTWQDGLAAYAPWVIVILAIFFIIGAIQWIFGKSPNSTVYVTPIDKMSNTLSNSFAGLPSASSATNSLTSSINKTITAVKRNNANSPLIPGLGFSGSQV